jgi:hypothetical protein
VRFRFNAQRPRGSPKVFRIAARKLSRGVRFDTL